MAKRLRRKTGKVYVRKVKRIRQTAKARRIRQKARRKLYRKGRLSIAQVKRLYGVSRATLNRWRVLGLASSKVCGNVVVKRTDLMRWIGRRYFALRTSAN